MSDWLAIGFRRFMIPVPPVLWRRRISTRAARTAAGLRFMSRDHHRVRDFVVAELPRAGVPLSPGHIAGTLGLPADRVGVILDELEERLTFLYRNRAGEVVWAFPVTVEATPHPATLSTGEQAYAA